jgi:hypothetical protein
VLPVTIPEPDTEATNALELLHAPPGTTLASVVVLPTHKLVDPVIAGGTAFTVTILKVKQPVASM